MSEQQNSVEFDLAVDLLRDPGVAAAMMEFVGCKPPVYSNNSEDFRNDLRPSIVLHAGQTQAGRPAKVRLEMPDVVIYVSEAPYDPNRFAIDSTTSK